MSAQINSIAIIDPLGDFGIGGYSYELAEGLAAHGVAVDVYTNGRAQMCGLDLPRRHRIIPVLGSFLFRQSKAIGVKSPTIAIKTEAAPTHNPRPANIPPPPQGIIKRTMAYAMPYELALHLKRRGYDVIWTQWPFMERYGTTFWSVCRALRLNLIHTVHNVLPHEEAEDNREIVAEVYSRSRILIVHSDYSANDLKREFPECRSKTLKMRFGLYTMYPKPETSGRVLRAKLGIPSGAHVILFYGSIRPYKNIDGVLRALRDLPSAYLVVAGRESRYSDMVSGDPLGRTRRIAVDLGVSDRIKLIPGMLDMLETSNLFEAADILALPYLKSYGSGALLLGMTARMYILATETGGMDEYLKDYPAHTILHGTDAKTITEGIELAASSLTPGEKHVVFSPPDLDWKTIAGKALEDLEVLLRSAS